MIPRPTVMEKNRQIAQTLSDNNDGKLPNPNWMMQKGYGGLYRYIKRHSRAFKSFKFDMAVSRGRFNVAIRKEHIKTAQKLAKQNKGEIPQALWLNKNGHSRLAAYMRTYPSVFTNMK